MRREPLAVAYAAVRLDVDESPDIHLCLAAQVTFNQDPSAFNRAPDPGQVLFSQLTDPGVLVQPNIVQDLSGGNRANTMNLRESKLQSTVVWNIYAGDDRHLKSPV
jgi:hypothetical protein